MTFKAIIDFGSRSTKVYINNGEQTDLVFTHSKDLISKTPTMEEVQDVLRIILSSISEADNITAIATEAARRSTTLEFHLANSCKERGVSYRTIDQTMEANLIRSAFTNKDKSHLEIVNVGGGSMQIVRPDKTFYLVPFGISDLNRMFALNDVPKKRQIDKCLEFLHEKLPNDLGQFVYTGGERTYLTSLGAKLGQYGSCSKDEFMRINQLIAGMTWSELEENSPFDKDWMGGAVASNCIVEACFIISESSGFYPSDQNIAHGLVNQLMENKL